MPNEIYHRSNWGNANAEGFGDVYYDHAATNKLYNHSDYYENSDGTDATLKDLNNKASIVLTPTAYSDGSLNTVIPPYKVLPTELVTNGDFSDGLNNWTDASNWWSVVNGEAYHPASTSMKQLYQDVATEVNKKYKISVNVNIISGTPQVFWDKVSGQEGQNLTQGLNEIVVTTFKTNSRIYFGRVSPTNAEFYIDNVSVKEIQEADFDFSRGSSATRVNEQGLVEDSQGDDYPRIDFTDGTGSLLLEPQSTNLITYSEDFSQWGTVNGAVVTDNFTTSPDGTQNAAKVIYDGTSLGRIEISTGASGTNTQSIYLKTVSGTQAVSIGASSSDLTEVTVTSEWQRFTHTGSGSYPRVLCNDAATIYAWGAQLEAGSYATSYIVSNSGSATTRSADVANNSGNADLFNDSEGVLYAEIAALADDLSNRFISLTDGTDNNSVTIYYGGVSNRIRSEIKSGAVTQADLSTTAYSIINYNKIAVKYKQNSFSLYVNGTEVATDTSGSTPSGLNDLSFDRANILTFFGKTKCVAVFKEALSNDLLERLTGEGYESFRLLAEANNYTII